MAVETFTVRPGRVDIDGTAGNTWVISMEINSGGSDLNLTGASSKMQIKNLLNDTNALALTGSSSALSHNTSTGTITATITPAQTAALVLPTYRWAVQVTLSDGTVRDIVEGYANPKTSTITS